MKITVLIENKATKTLKSEHGLAIHIEYNGKNYLLDSGKSNKFLDNELKRPFPKRKLQRLSVDFI